mgnify:FL=1
MPMKEGDSVSVYISHPVPFRYSLCHLKSFYSSQRSIYYLSLRLFMSGLVLPALIANRFDIMELNPGARQDWAINPSLNSASVKT